MRKTILLSAFGLCTCLAFAAGVFRPLKVRTGLWQVTMTRKTTGLPPMTPDMQARLSQMTAQQRARIEAYLNRLTSGIPTTRTYKTCLTKENLNSNPFSEKDCTWKELTSTGTSLDAEGECGAGSDQAKTDISMHIKVVDSEHAKGSGRVVVTQGGRSLNSSFEVNSKYLGAACGDTH